MENPASYVDWSWVAAQLAESKNYWLCSVRPDGRPHAIPRWAVYLDGRIYYDGSPETRHAQNIESNPHVSIHLESGDQAIILEGKSAPAGRPDPDFAARLVKVYRKKYAKHGYSPEPSQWDEGGLYVFTPHKCLAWTQFNLDPTRFVFDLE